jgi:polyisoprenoid-binding protein YceI
LDVKSAADGGEPAGSAAVAGVRYVIDNRVSRFTVRAFATGLLSAFGHNPKIAIRDFRGEAVVNPQALEASSSVHVAIAAKSLAVADDIKDKDRREMEQQMQADVLESDRYPEIVYECTRVAAAKHGEHDYRIKLDGELTLHGVTRPQAVAARVSMTGEVLRAFGEFTLRQTDYEIKLVSAVGGTLRVKNELKATFDIVARKQDSSQEA